MEVDRIGDWQKFSAHMEQYITESVLGKYGAGEQGIDLMAFTGEHECLFSILKYALRMWNGRGKVHDWEKIAHYAQIGWNKKTE